MSRLHLWSELSDDNAVPIRNYSDIKHDPVAGAEVVAISLLNLDCPNAIQPIVPPAHIHPTDRHLDHVRSA